MNRLETEAGGMVFADTSRGLVAGRDGPATRPLILRGGRVVDPSQGLDEIADVAFEKGLVAGVGRAFDRPGAEEFDVSGRIVTPGLIDLHTHVYWGGTSLGVDAGELAAASGVTTFVDAGSAGPGNYRGFLKHVIQPSEVRILAYLHISFAGIYAFSRRIMVGESHDLRLMSPLDAVEVARAHRDTIIGIKVRVGRHASGNSGIEPLNVALQVAEETGLPLMVHIDEPPPSYDDVVALLRPGDVLTHCFRPFPNSPLSGDGRPRASVIAARQRGVLFDVGHGMGSFAFDTARRMLAEGFAPDTISSDIHDLNARGPVFDLPTTLSKFLYLGMPFADVIRAATDRPAAAIRRPNLGTLKAGAAGDATILSLERTRAILTDSLGEQVETDEFIRVHASIRSGRLAPIAARTSTG
jgi:dihydroorotase